MDFEPVLCDMDECTYVLKDTPETMEKYPFHFELEITHRLKGRTIETSWKVTNLNGKEMLFMIGGHPAFQVPEGKNIYDYTLVFNKEGVKAGEHQDSLHYQAPNAEGYEDRSLQGDLPHQGVCHNDTNRPDDQVCVSGIDDHRIFAGGSIRGTGF